MCEEPHYQRSYLFTVRIWLENLGDGQTEWRGKAQAIPSGQTCYFREWSKLRSFLLEMLERDEG